MRTPILALIVGGCTVAATAQPAQQAPVFRAGVRLVTIDVTVVDGDSRPVRGLTAADFTAVIDGKPRPIQQLDFLEFGAVRLEARPETPASVSTPGMVPGPAARRGPQTFLLVFDDLSFVPGAGKTLVTAAERMLDSLDLADLVGVATTSGFGPKVAPTRSRADVREALKTLVGTSVATADPFYVAGWEALEIERGFPRETIGVVAGRDCAEVDLGPA
jgi:hypothetical protein